MFMDKVAREVYVRVLVLGAGLQYATRRGGWGGDQLLSADVTSLMADSKEKFQRLVIEFGNMCKRK